MPSTAGIREQPFTLAPIPRSSSAPRCQHDDVHLGRYQHEVWAFPLPFCWVLLRVRAVSCCCCFLADARLEEFSSWIAGTGCGVMLEAGLVLGREAEAGSGPC